MHFFSSRAKTIGTLHRLCIEQLTINNQSDNYVQWWYDSRENYLKDKFKFLLFCIIYNSERDKFNCQVLI